MTIKITGTNTAAAPGITGDDTDTGLVYGTNQVDISTGGTSRVTVDGSGNIDIPDAGKIRLGDSQDLIITHNGTQNIIGDTATQLRLITDQLRLRSHTGSETYAQADVNGAFSLNYNNSQKFATTDYGCEAKTIKPDADNTHDLGASDQRWDDVYATNGTIQTSDRNAKKDIVKSDLGLTFINAVEPVSYKFKTGTRTHYGVIAQDLETVLDGKDFAGLTKDTETGNYGVRYTELISPLIKAVQELSTEVETLKTKVAALEAHTHE